MVLLSVTIPLAAQIGGSGSIQGVVSDPSGAVIPGATVVATNVGTGVRTTRQTTVAGYYVLSPLAAGEYTVSVTAAGFRTLSQEHVRVDALTVVGLDLTLKIGPAAEQITVSDTPPPVNASDARIGETVRNAGSCYAHFNPKFSGEARINGDYRSRDRMGGDATAFIDKNAFASPAAYTYGATPRTLVYKLHNPSVYNRNASLKREFPIRESWRLTFQVDAFNVFNWVTWSAPNINVTNANFGRITAQSNSAGVVQFNARVEF